MNDAPDCPVCDGPGTFLGALGSFFHWRCRNCGIDYHSHNEQPDDVRVSRVFTYPSEA